MLYEIMLWLAFNSDYESYSRLTGSDASRSERRALETTTGFFSWDLAGGALPSTRTLARRPRDAPPMSVSILLIFDAAAGYRLTYQTKKPAQIFFE